MTIPTWVSWSGLLLHLLAGALLSLLLEYFGASRTAIFVAVLAVAIAHEQAQAAMGGNDFATARGGPWNGLLDVVTFLVVPVVRMIW